MKIRTFLIIILLTTALTPLVLVMGLNLPRVLTQFNNAEQSQQLLVLQQDHLEVRRDIAWCQNTLRALSFIPAVIELASNTSATFPKETIEQRLTHMIQGWYQNKSPVLAVRIVSLNGKEQLKMLRSPEGILLRLSSQQLYDIDLTPFQNRLSTQPAHAVFNAGINRNQLSQTGETAIFHLAVDVRKEGAVVGVVCLAFDLAPLVNKNKSILVQQNNSARIIYSAPETETIQAHIPIADHYFSPGQPALVSGKDNKTLTIMPLFIGDQAADNIWMVSMTTPGDTMVWVKQWRQQLLLLLGVFITTCILLAIKFGSYVERFSSELCLAFRDLLHHQRPMRFSSVKTKELQELSTELSTLSRQYLKNVAERQSLHQEAEVMERKLRQSQKMEAIGLLAGGVAHDLNNILSGIISYPQLLLMQLPEESELRQPILEIQHSGERAAAVVTDLLTVARGVACKHEVEDLNTLVTEYLDSPEYKQLAERHPLITCRCNLADTPLPISCSAIHIKKSIMNLITNATEAMHDAGTIHINTYKLEQNSPEDSPEPWAILTIQDEGDGIPPEDIDHIFEPFYSKKKMGRSGTGLGLAVVWNSMQDHNGTVSVKSSSKGTTFTLSLPLTTGVKLPSPTTETQDLHGHGEHILVIDDEPQQQDIARKIMTAYGYKVDVVSSGEEAVAFCKTQQVDLLLLDMIMDPGINGRQTYEQISALFPGQKAIICSGFSESDEVTRAHACGAHGFLKKPYDMEQLALAVKQELAS